VAAQPRAVDNDAVSAESDVSQQDSTSHDAAGRRENTTARRPPVLRTMYVSRTTGARARAKLWTELTIAVSEKRFVHRELSFVVVSHACK
jgi:hypothetical protein